MQAGQRARRRRRRAFGVVGHGGESMRRPGIGVLRGDCRATSGTMPRRPGRPAVPAAPHRAGPHPPRMRVARVLRCSKSLQMEPDVVEYRFISPAQ